MIKINYKNMAVGFLLHLPSTNATVLKTKLNQQSTSSRLEYVFGCKELNC
jgi:hypothetical protein